MDKISWTLNLPPAYRGEDLGWAVSSDAHFPEEQFIVGSIDVEPSHGETFFDLLEKRLRFEAVMISDPSENSMVNNFRLFRNVRCAMTEGINKDIRMMRMGPPGNGNGDGSKGNGRIVRRVGREVRRRALKAFRQDK
jgi:hypothetical protein